MAVDATSTPSPADSSAHQYSDAPYEPLVADSPDTAAGVTAMGYDEQILKPERRQGDVPALLAASIATAIFVLSTWGITFASHPTSLGLFFFHPILQSLAIAVFAYGIMTLQPTSQPRTKAAGLTRHQLVILAIGLPAIGLGTLAIVYRKSLHGHAHFTTWHGTIGIVSVAWLVAQIILGGGSVWFGGRLFGGNPKAKLLWKYHRLSGYVLLFLFLFAAYLGGAWSNWTTDRSPYVVRLLAFTISPIVIYVAIFIRVRVSKMRFF